MASPESEIKNIFQECMKNVKDCVSEEFEVYSSRKCALIKPNYGSDDDDNENESATSKKKPENDKAYSTEDDEEDETSSSDEEEEEVDKSSKNNGKKLKIKNNNCKKNDKCEYVTEEKFLDNMSVASQSQSSNKISSSQENNMSDEYLNATDSSASDIIDIDNEKILFIRDTFKITAKCLKQIHRNEMLNDTIVSYGIFAAYNKLSEERKKSIYICDIFKFKIFAESITTASTEFLPSTIKSAKKRNIFGYQYIYIPITYNYHFSMVCLVKQKQEKNFRAIAFDSIHDAHFKSQGEKDILYR
jgi:Ulp1 family protease